MDEAKTWTEKDLIVPALKVLYEHRSLTMTELIRILSEKLPLSDYDRQPNNSRSDSRFSQKVRNLISHKTILPYVFYDSGSNTLTINENGINLIGEISYDDDDALGLEASNWQDFSLKHETINVERINSSVYELKRKFDRYLDGGEKFNTLILDPDFQRNSVWSNKQNSLLIESVLLGIPLPMFYLVEDEQNNLIVIDGRQRLNALFSFLDEKNGYKLSKLEFLDHLSNRDISEFTGNWSIYKARLEDTILSIYKIKRDTPEELKLQIFARLNTQGAPLNAQEVRHALHRGHATIMLKKLSDELDIGVSKTRMKDRYLWLRLIALLFYFENDPLLDEKTGEKLTYNNINSFLGNVMDVLNNRLNLERLISIADELIITYNSVIENFGKSAFRFKDDSPINMILFEITMMLAIYSKGDIMGKLNEIIHNPNFNDNIKYHRDSKENYEERIRWIREVIKENDK